MRQQPIRFNDGQAYECAMGVWSQLVAPVFLDWLAVNAGDRWIDIGCGNGAFSEVLIQRCSPGEMIGIDQSEEQLSFARKRAGTRGATFLKGDAMALPFDDDRFDVAVMALVLFFLRDPINGVAEMSRVVCPGGTVAAYVWDTLDGGSPSGLIQAELRARGVELVLPPRADVSRKTKLRELWTNAGLIDVTTKQITVRKTFVDFDEFWLSAISNQNVRQAISLIASSEVGQLKCRLRASGAQDASGRVTYQARANAVKGNLRSA